jgi:hypothetical protein
MGFNTDQIGWASTPIRTAELYRRSGWMGFNKRDEAVD